MRRQIRWSLWMVVAVALLGSAPVSARELFWRELAVTAHLDADGVLAVEERHTMVMTGDWNGGERIFALGPGHRLSLVSVERLRDAWQPMQRGDLSIVDHWDWVDGVTLRWRSRAPGDPLFDQTELVYRIAYTLGGIVERRGDRYRFRHDFAFPDRVGTIERFTLDLSVDPAWQERDGEELRRHCEEVDLVPGHGVILGTTFDHVGDAEPASVREPYALWPVALFLLAGLAATVMAYRRFVDAERPLGAFASIGSAPLEHLSEPRAWFGEHVLAWKPEQVGALWDQKVGPAEVAAVLARWVAEGKVRSEVERRGWFGRRVLVLERRVGFDSFDGYDGKLARKLFFNRRKNVSTDDLKRHYRKKGFDPAGVIRRPIDRSIARVSAERPLPKPRVPGWAVLLAGVAAVALDLLVRRRDVFVPTGDNSSNAYVLWVIFGFFGAVLLTTALLSIAAKARRSVASVGRLVSWLPLLTAVGLLSFAGMQWLARARLWFGLTAGFFGQLGTLLIILGLFVLALRAARTRLTSDGIALRRTLAAARRWLRDELDRAKPRLDDAWFPYLVAFGLDRQVDRWFNAFGDASSVSSRAGRVASSGGLGSSGGGAGSWTGGGGGFGGAGATAAWATAASGMAAGVSAASSGSGGSSGGGGGGSSGGGGGGGW